MAVAGWHLQGGADKWTDGARHLPSWDVIKFVDGGQRAAEAKAINPGFHCHLRHHVGEQNPPQFAQMLEHLEIDPADKFVVDPDELPYLSKEAQERFWYSKRYHRFFSALDAGASYEAVKEHARAYFRSFVDASFDQFARYLNSVSEYNEYFSNSQTQAERTRWIQWATACVEVWRDEYRPRYPWIGLVLAETAVGNDIPVELAALSHQYDWVHLGYHPYVPVYKGVIRPDAWRWYSGRWEFMDASYREAGYTRVTWFFGEFGAVGHTRPPEGDKWFNALDPMGGWRHKNVYNGNISMFNHMILDWMTRAAETLAWKENRVIGATIFTSGGWKLWEWFELSGNDIIEVGKFIGANAPAPGDGPPPPPPEPEGLVNGYWGNRNWSDIPGTNKQRPYGWQFEYTLPGQALPSGRKLVTTLSESVHKFVIPTPPDTRPTLPASEGYGMVSEGHTWDDGRDGLVLKNPNTYKTFGTGTWHDRLWQVADFGEEKANTKYKMTAYVDVHWHGFPPGNNPLEKEDIVINFICSNQTQKLTSHGLPDRTWRKVEIVGQTDEKGQIYIGVDIEAYWAHPRTVWLGGFELQEIQEGPEDKCDARQAYAREYWVLAADTTLEQHLSLVEESREKRVTIGYSYDDAGIGCGLRSRKAVLFGLTPAFHQTFIDWYETHYTGTVVEFRDLPSP